LNKEIFFSNCSPSFSQQENSSPRHEERSLPEKVTHWKTRPVIRDFLYITKNTTLPQWYIFPFVFTSLKIVKQFRGVIKATSDIVHGQ
jgi:hypothetical protein